MSNLSGTPGGLVVNPHSDRNHQSTTDRIRVGNSVVDQSLGLGAAIVQGEGMIADIGDFKTGEEILETIFGPKLAEVRSITRTGEYIAPTVDAPYTEISASMRYRLNGIDPAGQKLVHIQIHNTRVRPPVVVMGPRPASTDGARLPVGGVGCESIKLLYSSSVIRELGAGHEAAAFMRASNGLNIVLPLTKLLLYASVHTLAEGNTAIAAPDLVNYRDVGDGGDVDLCELSGVNALVDSRGTSVHLQAAHAYGMVAYPAGGQALTRGKDFTMPRVRHIMLGQGGRDRMIGDAHQVMVEEPWEVVAAFISQYPNVAQIQEAMNNAIILLGTDYGYQQTFIHYKS